MRTFSLFGIVLLFGFVGAGTAMAQSQCVGTPNSSTLPGTNNFCLTGVGNGE